MTLKLCMDYILCILLLWVISEWHWNCVWIVYYVYCYCGRYQNDTETMYGLYIMYTATVGDIRMTLKLCMDCILCILLLWVISEWHWNYVWIVCYVYCYCGWHLNDTETMYGLYIMYTATVGDIRMTLKLCMDCMLCIHKPAATESPRRSVRAAAVATWLQPRTQRFIITAQERARVGVRSGTVHV